MYRDVQRGKMLRDAPHVVGADDDQLVALDVAPGASRADDLHVGGTVGEKEYSRRMGSLIAKIRKWLGIGKKT